MLPWDLFGALDIALQPYDPYSSTPENLYYAIAGEYGNNGCYDQGVHVMLEQLRAGGARLFLRAPLESIQRESEGRVVLVFGDGQSVLVEPSSSVIINLPKSALMAIEDNIILTDGTDDFNLALPLVLASHQTKVYAYYDQDAWWLSKLGLLTGTRGSFESDPALSIDYHDGPVLCWNEDRTGYAPAPVPFGECTGVLEVAYHYTEATQGYFKQFHVDENDPLVRVFGGQSSQLIRDIHDKLMVLHASQLQEVGVDPATISYPSQVVMGIWEDVTPRYQSGYHSWNLAGMSIDEIWNSVRMPLVPVADRGDESKMNNNRVYLVNEAWGRPTSWLEGSLLAAEKVLSFHFSLPAPTWLDPEYYDENVAS
jgi:hypothetical protein